MTLRKPRANFKKGAWMKKIASKNGDEKKIEAQHSIGYEFGAGCHVQRAFRSLPSLKPSTGHGQKLQENQP